MDTVCPHCGATITVPAPQDDDAAGDDAPDPVNLDDIDALLNPGASLPYDAEPPPAVPSRPAKPIPPSRPALSPPPPPPPPAATSEPPLFERDLDAVLGAPAPAPLPTKPLPPRQTSGKDASDVGRAGPASRKTTAVVILVVLLLGAAFLAGFFIALR